MYTSAAEVQGRPMCFAPIGITGARRRHSVAAREQQAVASTTHSYGLNWSLLSCYADDAY